MATQNEKGWWINAKGDAVHPDLVKVDDKLKDELIATIIGKARLLDSRIGGFRESVRADINGFFDLLLQEYGMERKVNPKGNLTLDNFSGTQRVEIATHDTLAFDEKLQIAKMMIDEYLMEVTEGSSAEIQTLIMSAFDVDKKGNIDAKKIFSLTKLDIPNAKWQQAMAIIDESKHIAASKSYVRIYQRADTDAKWEMIPLRIAASKGA